MVDVKPEDTSKPKIRRRKDLLVAASKENPGDLPQGRVTRNSKTGGALS